MGKKKRRAEKALANSRPAQRRAEKASANSRPAHPLPVLPQSSDSLGSAARGGHLLGLANLRHRRVTPRWSGKELECTRS